MTRLDAGPNASRLKGHDHAMAAGGIGTAQLQLVQITHLIRRLVKQPNNRTGLHQADNTALQITTPNPRSIRSGINWSAAPPVCFSRHSFPLQYPLRLPHKARCTTHMSAPDSS